LMALWMVAPAQRQRDQSCGGVTQKGWSQLSDLNRRPTVYKTLEAVTTRNAETLREACEH